MNIDQSLLKSCQNSNDKAIMVLYKQTYDTMKSICTRYIHQPSEVSDVMNQGFLKILKGLNSYDPSRSFESWVSRIIINTCIDHLRKKQRDNVIRSVDPLDYTYAESNGIYDRNLADLNFDAEELLDMLRKLPDKTARVFNLFAIDGFSHKEISELFQISIGTSKWHVSKARELLKILIEKKTVKENLFL